MQQIVIYRIQWACQALEQISLSFRSIDNNIFVTWLEKRSLFILFVKRVQWIYLLNHLLVAWINPSHIFNLFIKSSNDYNDERIKSSLPCEWWRLINFFLYFVVVCIYQLTIFFIFSWWYTKVTYFLLYACEILCIFVNLLLVFSEYSHRSVEIKNIMR